MSSANKKAEDWFRLKLLEEVKKKEVLYKDKEENKAVMKDKETDVHDSVSDLLLRVLSKEDIKKLNYINGFNPEKEIRGKMIPNPKKEKIKESILKEDEEGNNAAGEEAPQEPVEDVEEEPNLALDTGDAEPVSDVENTPNADESEEEEDDSDKEEKKDKGVGAFERILDRCDKEEILSKAIAAVNSSNISDARDLFYDWFDSFDNEHSSDELPLEDEEIISDEEGDDPLDVEDDIFSDGDDGEQQNEPEETSDEDKEMNNEEKEAFNKIHELM